MLPLSPTGSTMQWKPMTIDDYALFHQINGTKVVNVDGIWWREVRPFFFSPVFPFLEISSRSSTYPLRSKIGGIHHLVPSGLNANSYMHFFVYDYLQSFCFDQLPSKRKKEIHRWLQHFSARQITDMRTLHSAYDIYLSYYNRMCNGCNGARPVYSEFLKWTNTLYSYPQVLKLGIYKSDKLCAIATLYQVNDVIICGTFFSNFESEKLRVTDFVYYLIRELSVTSDAKYIYLGRVTGKRELDELKLQRGCRILSLPAYCKVNPMSLYLLKGFIKNKFSKSNLIDFSPVTPSLTQG